MILHTVINEAEVFYDKTPHSIVYKPIKGGHVEYRRCPDGYRLSRLYSTDPSDYLNKAYYPY